MKKSTMKRYAACIMTAALLLMTMAGCDASEPEETTDYPVALYYVNPEYIETGDESVDPMIVKEAVLTMETEDAEERYEETLELLVKAEDSADTMVREGMVDEVTVSADGVATVDFNGEQMTGGSTEETYLIEQVVRTLVKSFDNIDKVGFTVDEQPVESLMGHLSADCLYGLLTVDDNGEDVELVSILQ